MLTAITAARLHHHPRSLSPPPSGSTAEAGFTSHAEPLRL